MKRRNEFNKALECQNVFFQKLNYYIDKFSDKVDITYNEFPTYLEQMISLTNTTFGKRIQYSLVYGTNMDGNKFTAFRLYIQNFNEDKSEMKQFSIIDFIENFQINKTVNWFHIGEIDLIKYLNTYLDDTISILSHSYLTQILFTDKWHEIPVNMSPYK